MQIINFDGTIYVRSSGKKEAPFTIVPFKIVAGGGGGGGTSYTLPTAGASVKGGIKVGSGLKMTGEVMSVEKQIDNWATGKSYATGDIVVKDGKLYQCNTAHTSSNFVTDSGNWDAFSADIANWLLFYADISPWQSNTYYVVNSCVIEDGKLYQCKTAHTSHSTAFANDIANWTLIGGTSINAWQASTSYSVGDLVIESNKLYQCKMAHTSGATFVNTNWNLIGSDDTIIKSWVTSTSYKVNQVVEYNNDVYMCLIAHTSGTFNTDCSNGYWCRINDGVKTWQSSTFYPINSIIYDATTNCFYTCKSAHISSSAFITDSIAGKWAVIGKEGLNSITQETLYSGTTAYGVGDNLITLSKDVTDYDYLILKHGKYTSETATLVPVDSNLITTGGGCFLSYWYSSNNWYAGWVTAPDNTHINFHITNRSDTVDIKLMEVVGIKFNSMTISDISNLAMPSQKYITLSSVTSGMIYTAPADGLLYVEATVSTTSWVRLDLDVVDSSNVILRQERSMNYGEAHGMDTSIMVAKGDRIKITLPTTASSVVGKFFYTIGAAKEAGLI